MVSCAEQACCASENSVGQLAIDALASRLGIRMSSVRGGTSGQATVQVGETLVDLTLFKSSMCRFRFVFWFADFFY